MEILGKANEVTQVAKFHRSIRRSYRSSGNRY